MKNKGFTLIELMIVVVIIGVFATIAIPAYNDFKDASVVTNGSNITPPKFTSKQTIVRQYLPNQNRMSKELTLKQHSDGTLYACEIDDETKCYRVK